jgi:hypothetical protein
VAGIQLDQLRSSPFSKTLPREWLALLEPFQQASQVWAAYNGKDLLLIARGQFPPAPPGAILAAHGLALAGSANAIKAAEQQHTEGHAMGGQGRSSQLLEKAKPVQNEPIWAVIRGDARLPLRGNSTNFERILAFTEYTAASARWDSAIELSLTGYCATAEKAQDLEESLRAMLTLGRKAAHAGEFRAALESMRIDRQQTKVLVRLTAPPAVLLEMLR